LCYEEQFVRRSGHIRFLESSTGDVGLMQVNKHVWRGFYDLSRLEWDVVYNTSEDAGILIRLMRGAAEHTSATASSDGTVYCDGLGTRIPRNALHLSEQSARTNQHHKNAEKKNQRRLQPNRCKYT
jgi:hypothetical protein